MTGRVKGELKRAEVPGLVKVEKQGLGLLQPMFKNAGGGRGRDNAAVPLDVVRMSVRDDGACGAPPRIQPEVNFGQIDAFVVNDFQPHSPSDRKPDYIRQTQLNRRLEDSLSPFFCSPAEETGSCLDTKRIGAC